MSNEAAVCLLRALHASRNLATVCQSVADQFRNEAAVFEKAREVVGQLKNALEDPVDAKVVVGDVVGIAAQIVVGDVGTGQEPCSSA